MAVTKTPRFQLDQWSAGSDPRPGRVDTNRIHALIESQAAKVYPSGVLSDRPATNVFGSFYLATDQGVDGRLYYNGGTGWVALNTVGGGGPGRPLIINGGGDEGSSLLAARADHTHAIPLATKNNAGAMASQWAELCENASSSASAGSVAVRDSGGRLAVQRPVSAQHAVNMDYLDSLGTPGNAGNTIMTRNAQGRSSVSSPQGPFDVVNKQYADSLGTPANAGNTIMTRNAAGRSTVSDPDGDLDITNKRYVNSRASRREWKTNIRGVRDALTTLQDIPVYRYDYKDDAPDTGTDVVGYMVDDVHTADPRLTITGGDGRPERVRHHDINALTMRAVQQLAERVESLAEEVDRLYARAGEDDA